MGGFCFILKSGIFSFWKSAEEKGSGILEDEGKKSHQGERGGKRGVKLRQSLKVSLLDKTETKKGIF